MSCITIGARRTGQIVIGASLVCDVGSLVRHLVLKDADGLVLRSSDEYLLEVYDEEDEDV